MKPFYTMDGLILQEISKNKGQLEKRNFEAHTQSEKSVNGQHFETILQNCMKQLANQKQTKKQIRGGN